MPQVKLKIKTAGQKFEIEVKPWLVIVNAADPAIDWTCKFNNQDTDLKVVLFSPQHFDGGQPTPGVNPKTGAVKGSVTKDKPYRYRLRVEDVSTTTGKKTVVIDPEYEYERD